MPADSVNGLATADGPAIQMDPMDHRATASWGNSASAKLYRATLQALIDNGHTRLAMEIEIMDIQTKFGNKYDAAIKQMMDYAESIGYFK